MFKKISVLRGGAMGKVVTVIGIIMILSLCIVPIVLAQSVDATKAVEESGEWFLKLLKGPVFYIFAAFGALYGAFAWYTGKREVGVACVVGVIFLVAIFKFIIN